MSVVGLGAGLEGQGVVVTGAAGGIGTATATTFAQCGARVMVVDLQQEAVDRTVASLPGDGHVGVAADLCDLATHQTLIERAVTDLGSLRCLAHLAAVLRRRAEVTDVTEDDWDRQLDVNLKATFFLCRAVAEAMREHGGGSIVTFASQAAWTGGFGGSTVYGATKGGVVSLTRGLARTYGPQGIRVNTVAPGHITTPMLVTGLDDEVRDRLVTNTPLRRLGSPEEVSGAVVFLASDHASFISGATIDVSGGFLMH
ncbi:SDR family NAD(P)-dependent oxidoreductase [Actinophytocola sp.]|uniref:SDR family NAD(P)-dependent oxidoreductase n=1 Tax=Actinophytocola sp. TaxID=1872138 RepID=UPI002ED22D5C